MQDFPDKSPPALRPSPDGRWTLKVSIYPKVSGSISDAQVQADPEKYNNAQVATEDMLTPDQLSWTLGATVGIKYSKQFFQSLRFVKAA